MEYMYCRICSNCQTNYIIHNIGGSFNKKIKIALQINLNNDLMRKK